MCEKMIKQARRVSVRGIEARRVSSWVWNKRRDDHEGSGWVWIIECGENTN
jgi:hypothetical protein